MESFLARVLLVYHRTPYGEWRSAYDSHLHSLRRYGGHAVYYLNTARAVTPSYVRSLRPDLIVFHYTFLAWRQSDSDFAIHAGRVAFTRAIQCPKAIVPHDEHFRSDLLCAFIRDHGVTDVFTPAPPEEWTHIYEGVDVANVTFHPVLTGYVDDSVVRKTAKLAGRHRTRTIDIGYRSWSTGPWLGRHGMLKQQVGEAFLGHQAARGLRMDISSERSDALFGDRWLEFLLDCKYTIGVEGGSSVFDRDGSIARGCHEYLEAHPSASFEAVESACFPGMDGQFAYRLIGPRHLEAAMTQTCQVLVRGDYSGVLSPSEHYIALDSDFGNLDAVLEVIREDASRADMVERAYNDVIASGRYSYRAFAHLVCGAALRASVSRTPAIVLERLSPRLLWNRIDERLWPHLEGEGSLGFRSLERLRALRNSAAALLRPVASRVVGEERLTRLLSRARESWRSARVLESASASETARPTETADPPGDSR